MMKKNHVQDINGRDDDRKMVSEQNPKNDQDTWLNDQCYPDVIFGFFF